VDVQGCTNIAVAWMQKSVDVQGCTNIAIAGARERVFDIAKHVLRCALVFFRGRCSAITEWVNNETIEYSIFSITYRAIARSTDEFRIKPVE